jgi:uncharacterized protein YlxW (UPF0749 family)
MDDGEQRAPDPGDRSSDPAVRAPSPAVRALDPGDHVPEPAVRAPEPAHRARSANEHAPAGSARGSVGSHVARRRISGWTAGVVVVATLAGGLFALSAQTAAGVPLRADRADRASLVQSAQARNAELKARLRQIQRQNDARTASFAAVDSRVAALQASSAGLAASAGFAPVRGPVVEVTLDDAPRGAPVPSNITADDLVVHQQDVQAVVNALWRGGAEAMMLMDQRVVSTSAVRCVGNTLILQGRVYSPPYTIRAIGDAGRLRQALASSPEIGIYREFVDLVGLRYDVEDVGEKDFPAFDGATRLKYAHPVQPVTEVVSARSASPDGTSPAGASSGASSAP